MASGVRRSAAEWAALIDEWRHERPEPAGVLRPARAEHHHDAGLGLQADPQGGHRTGAGAAAATGAPGGDPPAAAAPAAFLPVRVTGAADGA